MELQKDCKIMNSKLENQEQYAAEAAQYAPSDYPDSLMLQSKAPSDYSDSLMFQSKAPTSDKPLDLLKQMCLDEYKNLKTVNTAKINSNLLKEWDSFNKLASDLDLYVRKNQFDRFIDHSVEDLQKIDLQYIQSVVLLKYLAHPKTKTSILDWPYNNFRKMVLAAQTSDELVKKISASAEAWPIGGRRKEISAFLQQAFSEQEQQTAPTNDNAKPAPPMFGFTPQ